ncbi:hypothetical protein NDN08_004339 [Rhodosorus marinus]|uniref:Uncharacterized protein n=1 Tax=Rhodosorus marinus TaxID=101924 RepID=A0AAV8UKZ4_9RHOD|nr:hypothetical protein NDN08_004339 [Rhodosorus marinus]
MEEERYSRREKFRDEVSKGFHLLKRYAKAWENVSTSGRRGCVEASNAVLVLRELADGFRNEEGPGGSTAINAERMGSEALDELEASKRTMERLLGGMKLVLESMRRVADSAMMSGAAQLPVFATLPAMSWEEMAGEVLLMHLRDYNTKINIINSFLREDFQDRKSLSIMTSMWLTQPNVHARRCQMIFFSFEAEVEAAEELSASTDDTVSSSAPSGRSEAVRFLLQGKT